MAAAVYGPRASGLPDVADQSGVRAGSSKGEADARCHLNGAGHRFKSRRRRVFTHNRMPATSSIQSLPQARAARARLVAMPFEKNAHSGGISIRPGWGRCIVRFGQIEPWRSRCAKPFLFENRRIAGATPVECVAESQSRTRPLLHVAGEMVDTRVWRDRCAHPGSR
jgi:hypothetical protein